MGSAPPLGSQMKGTNVRAAILLVAFIGGSTLVALADEPLRPPHRHTTCSPSGEACVTSDPEAGTFGHPPGTSDPGAAPWILPSWFRVAYIANDGDHLVTGYDGRNLVPLENPEEIEILSFWRSGEPLRSYRLFDLIASKKALRRTASHYHWGRYEGFDEDGNFRLSTVEGVVLVFSPKTGEILRRERSAGYPTVADPS